VIAIQGFQKPVYRDPARLCNTEPALKWPNADISGIGVVPKGHIQNFKSELNGLNHTENHWGFHLIIAVTPNHYSASM